MLIFVCLSTNTNEAKLIRLITSYMYTMPRARMGWHVFLVVPVFNHPITKRMTTSFDKGLLSTSALPIVELLLGTTYIWQRHCPVIFECQLHMVTASSYVLLSFIFTIPLLKVWSQLANWYIYIYIYFLNIHIYIYV